jgi:SAM-dependent methyltransferase
MLDYYGRRAREYEQHYHRDDPARQQEQNALADALKKALRGRRVLELACGTGYWTQSAAEVARHVVATDASADMLALAADKGLLGDLVEFRLADAYRPCSISGTFDAVLANFWFSHVPKSRVHEFVDSVHARIGRGSIVFMADNTYVPGIGGELLHKPDEEDTYKCRTLSDGSQYEVLKNYYDADQLHQIFDSRTLTLDVHIGQYFWWIAYETSPQT